MSTVKLPDPQLMADAQSLTFFASAVSQAAARLLNNMDPASPEFEELKSYFHQNLPKLKIIIDRLESDLG